MYTYILYQGLTCGLVSEPGAGALTASYRKEMSLNKGNIRTLNIYMCTRYLYVYMHTNISR